MKKAVYQNHGETLLTERHEAVLGGGGGGGGRGEGDSNPLWL